MSDLAISGVSELRKPQALQFMDLFAQPVEPAAQPAMPTAALGEIGQLLQQIMQLLPTLLAGLQSPKAAAGPQSLAAGLPGAGGAGGGAGAAPELMDPTPRMPTPVPAPAPAPNPWLSLASPSTPAAPAPSSVAPASAARSVQQAAANTHPTFMPVLRGDEAQKDAGIKTQAGFGRAADQVAKDYGLDPNLFRAQLQAESSAFTQPFQKAMQAEGDLDRRGENNTSIGLGQISRKFLDGREWSDGGPGNARVGHQVVSTEDYMASPTIQLRTAASNIAQRIADKGGVEQGLSSYVSGNPDPSNPSAQIYLHNINQAMNDPAITDVGRE
jgi:hypothetical protein